MKVKIGLSRAYKAAKANGYTGPEELAAVRKWFADENVRSENGEEFEVVAKTVTISVNADAGEDVQVQDASQAATTAEMPVGESADAAKSAELRSLREKARELDAIKGMAASGVNAAMAKIHGGLSPKNHANIAGRKAYTLKAARGETVFVDADEADAFGAWIRLTHQAWREYPQKAADREILSKSGITTTFTSTGALVPPEFYNRLIDITLQYGVMEGLLYNQPMTSDVGYAPRITGGLTVYTPGEAGAITTSDISTDQVGLVARKRATLSKVSSETMNDSAFSIADIISRKIALAFATDDDNRAVNGDGTSTYAGDVGLRAYIKALSGTIAYIGGLFVGTGNTYAELTWNDFLNTEALLPLFQNPTGEARWLMHPKFYKGVVMPLIQAAGGVTGMERANGVPQLVCNGSPVVLSNQMPSVEGNSQVCALYGHFDMAGAFGRVRSMEISTSTDSDFANDLVAIRGIQRTAVTIHDMGTAGASSAGNAGPVVGLITAAS